MTLNTRFGIALLAGLAATAPVWAQNNNGTLNTAYYGAAKAVQTNPTGFGDATTTTTSTASGSELDALYARSGGGALQLFLSGNLESNFNPLELFFDTGAPGQNTLAGNADGNLNAMAGLTLPAGFNASTYITLNGGGSPYTLYGNYTNLTATGDANSTYLGNNTETSTAAPVGGTNPFDIRFTINNSNTGGVTGTTANAASATAVLTGVELRIPYAALGITASSNVKVFAFINGGGHGFVSNQSLGGLPSGTGNPGAPGGTNFTTLGAASVTVPGVAVVPEAGSGILFVLPMLGVVFGGIIRRVRKN